MIPIISRHREKLHELCRRFGVQRLELFGSAATGGEFDPHCSDLDFLVEYLAGQDLGPWMKRHFDFQEQLQELFSLPVDLMMASGLKNDRLVREVNRTRQTVYAPQDPQVA